MPDGAQRLPAALRRAAPACACALLAALAGLTWRQCGRYRDPVTFYRTAAELCPASSVAHNHYGAALAVLPGRMPEAIAQFEAALRARPDFAQAENNLGIALADELAKIPDRLAEAATRYEQALRISPDNADVHNNAAVVLAKLPGRMPEAFAHFEAALRIEPNDADMHYNLANQLAKMPGRLPEAAAQYEQAVRIRPDFTAAHYNVAVAYARTGRVAEAVSHFERVLELDPANRPAREYLEQLRSPPQ